jgi:nucleoside-diphosphate-sugar epimerase
MKNLASKKILISGSDGYIGTELVNHLESNHIPYTGIDKNQSSNKYCHQFNLSDIKQVQEIILSEKPEYFIHFATHSALAYNNDLLNAFNEDASALYNIISCLKDNENTRLVYFSSSYVYSGLDSTETVSEETILTPTHNFGLAKSFFEQMILRAHSNCVIFRLSSVFGKGNYLHPNAIEVMAKEAINDKILTIWGEGLRKMQYIFIEDVIKHILKGLEIPSGIYNLGGNSYETVIATANHIAEYFGAKTKILPDKKEGVTLPFMDNRKLMNVLDQNYFSKHKLALNQYLDDILS